MDFFICHSEKDGDFAELLAMKLRQAGYAVWLDSERLGAGEDWRMEIERAIRSCRAMILIMSPSARKSEYVSYEWAFGLGAGVRIIPIVLARTRLHPRIRALQGLDFTKRASRPWSQLFEALDAVPRRPRARRTRERVLPPLGLSDPVGVRAARSA